MSNLPAQPSVPLDGNEIVARYEQLRRQALGASGGVNAGLGLALLVRQGMKGWIEAWSHCGPSLPVKSQNQTSSTDVVPLDLRGEVVLILGGMALSSRGEARP
jgi:hypothetical protein